jgi:hypothetical protein
MPFWRQFNMNVSYTYRTDEADDLEQTPSRAPQIKDAAADLKTFTFSTVVYLGTIAPREGGMLPRKSIVPEEPTL